VTAATSRDRDTVGSRRRRGRTAGTSHHAGCHGQTRRTISRETGRWRDNSRQSHGTHETVERSYGNRRTASRTSVEISWGRNADSVVYNSSKCERCRGRVRRSTRRTHTADVHIESVHGRRSAREISGSRTICC